MKKILLIVFGLFIVGSAFAAKVDTVSVYSPSMRKNIKTVIVTPDAAAQKKTLPVVYLLHGHGGNYATWVDSFPIVLSLADQYDVYLVCPDGNTNWYWDSPVVPSMKYETFVSKELVEYVDKNYSTRANRLGRAISGFSMGGHGALFLAIRHQDVFGAAGSMSGGVDIRPFPNNWNMADWLGDYAEHPENWDSLTVINQLHNLKPNSLAMTIDCGTDDFFYEVNENLHRELLYRNIPHEYITRPGAHTGQYWNNSIKYHMMYFNNFFNTRQRQTIR